MERPKIKDYVIPARQSPIRFDVYQHDLEQYCNELEKVIELACCELENYSILYDHFVYMRFKDDWKNYLVNEVSENG